MLKGIISAIFLAVACTFLYGQQPNMATFLKEGAPVEVIPGMFTTYRTYILGNSGFIDWT